MVQKSLITEVWDPSVASKTKFYNEYVRDQKHPPENLAVFSYDITKLSMICRQKAEDPFNQKKFISCLQTEPFQGLTGRYQYKPGSAFPSKKVMITDFEARITNHVSK